MVAPPATSARTWSARASRRTRAAVRESTRCTAHHPGSDGRATAASTRPSPRPRPSPPARCARAAGPPTPRAPLSPRRRCPPTPPPRAGPPPSRDPGRDPGTPPTTGFPQRHRLTPSVTHQLRGRTENPAQGSNDRTGFRHGFWSACGWRVAVSWRSCQNRSVSERWLAPRRGLAQGSAGLARLGTGTGGESADTTG